MPRRSIDKAREDRNAALVETMLLEAAADGRLTPAELDTVVRRVVERPEFEGTHSEALTRLVEKSAARLAGAASLDSILKSLVTRLPGNGERRLAFGLAVAVAFADRRASRDELGVLKVIQAALGIDEDDVVRIIEVVERGGSLSDALGDRVERLCAEAMVLVSAADGEFEDLEARDMVEALLAEPAFRDLSRDEVRTSIAEAVHALATEGLERRLVAMARGLALRTHRLKAYELALSVARSGDGLTPARDAVLSLLQHTFELSDEDVALLRAN